MNGVYKAILDREVPGDFTLSFRVNVEGSKWGGLMLFARQTGPEAFYAFELGANQNKDYRCWVRTADGQTGGGKKGGRIAYGQWHDLKLTGRGDTYTLFLDGKSVMEITDGRYRSGRLGIGTFKCSARITDLSITTP